MPDGQDLPDADALLGPAPKGAAALPDADTLLGPPPGSETMHSYVRALPILGPIYDQYFTDPDTPGGRIMNAFGVGAKDAYGAQPLAGTPGDELGDFLRKNGVFNDYDQMNQSVVKTYNEAILRPALSGLDLAWRAGGAAIGGVSSAVEQAGQEAGAVPALRGVGPDIDWSTGNVTLGIPGLARDIAAAPQAFPLGGIENNMGQFRLPPTVQEARNLGVIGNGEAGWKGLTESTPPEFEPADINHITAEEKMGDIGDLFKSPAADTAGLGDAEPAPDIHATARQIAPQAFQQFDELASRQQTYRRMVADLKQTQVDALAPQHAEELDPILAQIDAMQSRFDEPGFRPTQAQRGRLDTLIDQRDEIQDRHAAELAQDTPDIQRVRAVMQAEDFKMRDLAPEVSAAYRQAEALVPQEAALEPPATEAAPAPAGAPSAATPSGAPPAADIEPVVSELAATPRPAAPPAPPATLPLPDIASDVSQKLAAAGRPADEASAAAAIVQDHFQARAARFGGAKGTAQDLYAAEGSGIRSAEQGGPGGSAGGKTTIKNGRAIITLFRKADASTFMHEVGHQWLNELMTDATDERAPDGLRQDAATVRDWLGVKTASDIKPRHHEKFARGFEQYLMEGRAPSRGLAGVFAKFKGWLTQIYTTADRLGAPITDDIRDVFARLISTDPERTVVAPDRAATEGLGERHQTIAETTPPERAGAAADQIRDERHAEAQAKVPGVLDELTGRRPPGDGTGGRAGGGGEPDRDATAAGPDGRGTGDAAAVGAERAGGGQVAAEGAGIRWAEPAAREALERIKLPPKPVRLLDWLRREGGIKDDGGELLKMLGDVKQRPGLINARGNALDEMALRASEEGYLPGKEGRPTIQDLLDAIERDIKGQPVYRSGDEALAREYETALARRSEIEMLAHRFDIDTAGKTRGEVYTEVAERQSAEDAAAEHASQAHAAETAMAEAEERAHALVGDAWEPEAFHEFDRPRSLEDLEHEYATETAARNMEQGEGGEPADGSAAGDQGGIPPRSGSRGHGDEYTSDRGDTGDRGDQGEPPKAANIRLDKINGSTQLSAALQDLAEQNGDFMDARYGSRAYQTALDIHNTRLLLRHATDEWMKSRDALTDTPQSIADYVTKRQRAAMIFDHLSSLSSDWAHAGHALNVVMPFDMSKDIAAQLKSMTGQTFFQIQEEAKLTRKFDTPEQAGKFASDRAKTPWEKLKAGLISLFINDLISGPLTHGAYSIGNTTFALFKATALTGTQAAIGAVREAIAGEPIDRAYFGEINAQLYGAVRGFRDGLKPGVEAFKTGVPVLPGPLQGELGLEAVGRREQAIPGQIGRILETPSRAVSMIHTVFYTMGYEQEIARLAYRSAARAGLEGTAMDTAIAKFTQSPPPEAMMAAHEEALRMVLMKRPEYGSRLQRLQSVVNDSLPLKIIMPFMQIGSNILGSGILDQTALSLLTADARAELSGAKGPIARDLRLAKIATGSMLGAATVGLAMEGLVTGGGPSDPGQRRVLENSGWKPYSLKWGDTYIPYRKHLGPLGPLVALHADVYEAAHVMGTQDISKAISSLAFGMSEVVADETWMSGLSNFIDAARHWDTNEGARYVRNLATSFIPFSVGLSQTARLVDPYARDAQTLLEAAQAKIPWASEALHPRIGIWGQPMPSSTMLSPGTATHDPVDARLEALNMGIAAPERKIRGVQLTEQQYEDFSRLSGTAAHGDLMRLVQGPGFASFPPERQTELIKKALEGARERARIALFAQSHGGPNDILAQANAAKRMQMTGTAAPAAAAAP